MLRVWTMLHCGPRSTIKISAHFFLNSFLIIIVILSSIYYNLLFLLEEREEKTTTMTALVAFVCGLIALSCFTNADVSHLQQSKTQYTGHRQRAHNSAASNGNANNNRYWWLRNTDNTNKQQSTSDQIPNTSNSVSNYVSNTGCNGCASQKVRLNRQNSNTPHNTAAYIRQNSYSNAKQSQQQQPNYYQKQPVSGFNSFQSFDSGRIQQQQQQSQSCSDLNSACVAQRFCNSGFIDSSFESKAVRSSVSLKNHLFVINISRRLLLAE